MPTATMLSIAPIARVPRPAIARPETPAPAPLPKVMLCEVIPIGGSEFRLRPLAKEWVTLNRKAAVVLDLDPAHFDTLRRLARAGFIRTRNISQRVVQVHLPSYIEHLHAVEADPWFWENPRHLARWRAACGHGV